MSDQPHPTYEISSFQDIIEKVPPDRIPTMLTELGDILSDMAELRNLSMACTSQAGMDLPADAITIKLPLVWTDDRKETHTLHLTTEGREICAIVSGPATDEGKESP